VGDTLGFGSAVGIGEGQPFFAAETRTQAWIRETGLGGYRMLVRHDAGHAVPGHPGKVSRNT